MQPLSPLRQQLKLKSNPQKAKILRGFFKTGKGEYGEGDVFLGVAVPEIRKIAKQHANLGLKEIEQLLKSKIHEERLAALLILVAQFQEQLAMISHRGQGVGKTHSVMINHNTRGARQDSAMTRHSDTIIYDSRWGGGKIFEFYLKNAKYVNNWDLVDLSAPKITGEYLNTKTPKDRKILYKLAKSKNVWERRIAIISTLAFIRENKFEDTLKISKILLNDKHDLIHKAVGWMLREVGKRSQIILERFLKANCKNMHRTTLRYAIERFPEKKRKSFLLKTCL